jgi:hypothetical protein
MPKSAAMVSFSTDFISHVRKLYQLSLEQRKSGKVAVHGINSYTQYAAPAYISAVAAVEAFLNEMAFNPMTQVILREAPLKHFDQDWLEWLDIKPKLQLIPQLLFDTTFDRATQPFQDFDLLVKVRNDFVHYKMHKPIPNYVQVLEQRSIALPASHGGADYAWVHKLSSSEGIRWAHNTACRVVQALAQMIPDKHRDFLAMLASGFVEIDESFAQALSKA